MLPGLLWVFLWVVVVGGLPARPPGWTAALASIPAWMRLAGGEAGRTPSPPPDLSLP